MNKKITVSVALAITLIAMTVTFTITMIVSMAIFDNTVSSVRKKQEFYDKLAEIDTYVRGNYYGDIDDTVLGDRVAQGYINGIGDSLSAYYNERDYNEMLGIESGTIVGIGVEVAKVPGGYFRVMKVYPGSPAAAAGITKMALIKAVDGRDVKEISSPRTLQTMLRGEQGTTVELTVIYDDNTIADQKFEIQRINYVPPTVEGPVFAEGFAYIRISSFGPATYTEFDYAVREALLADVKGLVFDVRGNTGSLFPSGQLEQAYKMIDMLCPLGTIARAELKSGVTRVLSTSDAENHVDIPMVVLVNGSTAAAAELFAASIRELSDGQLVGATTSGRGTIQRPPQRMSDGSAVSLTYGILRTASGGTFNGTGLVPDIEMGTESSDEASLYEADLVNDIVIIRGLELVRSMAKAAGLDVGTTPPAPPPASSSGASDTSGSSDVSSDDSGSDSDDGSDPGDDDSPSAGGPTSGELAE